MSFSNPFDAVASQANTALDQLGNNPLAGALGPGYGHAVFIEEQDVANPRRIMLSGRAMPYRGVAWGGEQAMKVTHYPGNPVATIQVLGPREDDTVMRGKWKDRFLPGAVTVSSVGGSSFSGGLDSAMSAANSTLGLSMGGPFSGSLDLAENLVQLFHGIRRAGTLLRVQWLGEVRFGVLSKFSATYDRAQDVEWVMEFEWLAWDDSRSTRSAAEVPSSSNIIDGLQRLVEVFSLAPVVAYALQASLVESVSSIGTLTRALFSGFEALDTVIDTPGAVLGAMQANGQELGWRLSELNRRLLDPRWPTVATAAEGPAVDPLLPPYVTRSALSGQLGYESWRRNTGAAAKALRADVERGVYSRTAKARPKATRFFTVGGRSSLYDVSNKFYGTPDFASYLAGVNKLGSVIVPAGTRLMIPPKPGTEVQFGSRGLANASKCGDGC